MQIFVECNTDYFLLRLIVRAIGYPENRVHHSGNKPKVLSQLEKAGRGIGIIDEDPDAIQPPLLKKYSVIDNHPNIRLLASNQQRIIVICPRLEDWLLQRTVHHQIPIKNHLNTPEKLHKMNPQKDWAYREIIESIHKNDNDIAIISSWIKEFCRLS